ncbi:Kelch-like protein diablo [Geodia barretti]|nr:Kelch-like protein diablo [Geodia barretti]
MSSESKALRKSYDQFMKGADPSSLVAPLYSQDLLTDDEKARALLDTQTNRKRLDEIFDALTRRVGVEPKAFLLIMQTLKNVPALKPMGEKMQELYNEVVGEFGCDSSNEHAIGRVEPSHSDSNSLPQLTSKANHQTKLTTSTFPPEAFSVFGTSIRNRRYSVVEGRPPSQGNHRRSVSTTIGTTTRPGSSASTETTTITFSLSGSSGQGSTASVEITTSTSPDLPSNVTSNTPKSYEHDTYIKKELDVQSQETAELKERLKRYEEQNKIVKEKLSKAQQIIREQQQHIEEMKHQQIQDPGIQVKQLKSSCKLTVKCNNKGKIIPGRMSRGSSTTDGRLAYFTPWGGSSAIYSYDWRTDKWEELPSCPCRNAGLAIIDGALTAVGGMNASSKPSNKLYTLRRKRWNDYLTMGAACSSPAIASTDNHVFVIGGNDASHDISTIKSFEIKSKRFLKQTPLPQALARPSATICHDKLHVIGANAIGFSCSLHALVSSEECKVTSLPQLPVMASTAASLCGQLVIIGGTPGSTASSTKASVNSIYQLMDEQWVEIGTMHFGRKSCFVVNTTPEKLVDSWWTRQSKNVRQY